MREVRKQFKVYSFKELSEEAQDKAVERYTSGDYPGYEWWDGFEFCIEEEAKRRGMAMNDKKDFWFNDYAYWTLGFDGYVSNQFHFAVKLFKFAKPDMRKRKDYEFWSRFLRSVRSGALHLSFSCKQNNYEGTDIEPGVENWVTSEDGGELLDTYEDTIQELIGDVVKDFCCDMAHQLEDEYDGMFERDYVVDEIEANEYEFYEDGTMYCGTEKEPEVVA